MYLRLLSGEIKRWADKSYIIILFGARQTGKTTLLRELFANASMWVDLSDPGQRTRYLARPGDFVAECRALSKSTSPHCIVIDEAQAVPAFFDAVQSLYDEDKSRWRFVLCGSSARKLRGAGANLLPGRAVYFNLYSLSSYERPFHEAAGLPASNRGRVVPLPEELCRPGAEDPPRFSAATIERRLAFGELPGIALAEEDERARLLKSYSLIYLEEEIRRESLVKDWGAFTRFLQLAAAESGSLINFSSISKEAGISVPTVKSYYQLLEDMFIGFRVPAFAKSPRKHILSTPEFFLFDNGVRHAAAGTEPGTAVVRANPGRYFEQWVAQELWKRLGYLQKGSLFHYRTRAGAEIDFIVELQSRFIPIEVKWTEHPSASDARHLIDFMHDMPEKADAGYIVCRCPRPMQVHEKVTAVPYWEL